MRNGVSCQWNAATQTARSCARSYRPARAIQHLSHSCHGPLPRRQRGEAHSHRLAAVLVPSPSLWAWTDWRFRHGNRNTDLQRSATGDGSLDESLGQGVALLAWHRLGRFSPSVRSCRRDLDRGRSWPEHDLCGSSAVARTRDGDTLRRGAQWPLLSHAWLRTLDLSGAIDRAAKSFRLVETIPLKTRSGKPISGLLNPQTVASKDTGLV